MAALYNFVVCAAMMVIAGFSDRTWNEIAAGQAQAVLEPSAENFTFQPTFSAASQEIMAPLSSSRVHHVTMVSETESFGTAGWSWSPWILSVLMVLVPLANRLSQSRRRTKDLESEMKSLYEVCSKKLAHDRQWIVSLETHSTAADVQVQDLEAELAGLKEEIAGLSAAVVSSRNSITALEKSKVDAEERAMKAENSVGDLTAQLSEALANHDSVERDLASALDSNSEKQRTIDSLETNRIELEADLDTSRALETYSDECFQEQKEKSLKLQREVTAMGKFISGLQRKFLKAKLHDELKSNHIIWLENEIEGLLNVKAVEAKSSGTSSAPVDNTATQQETRSSDLQLETSVQNGPVIEASAKKNTNDQRYTDASVVEENLQATDMPDTQHGGTQNTETAEHEGEETASDPDDEQTADKPKRRRQRGKHLSGAEKARRKKAREALQAELAAQNEAKQ